jgi:hypothetical protein
VPLAVRFVGGPLHGQIFAMQHAPRVLYAQRSVGENGVICVPSSYQGPDSLHAGEYHPGADSTIEGQLVYHFEGTT